MNGTEPSDPTKWMQWRFGDPRASVGSVGSVPHRRYEFARNEAMSLAQAAFQCCRVVPHIPSVQASLRTVLFSTEDDGRLIVVVGTHEPDKSVELALSYSLEHVGDRDLVFIVPVGTEWPFLARLPWIEHHTRVFTHGNGIVVEHPIPLKADVMARLVAEPASDQYTLSPEHQGWVDEVIAWANAHPRLQPSHRKAYLGWQVDGRLVLKINRAARGRLRIVAGAQSGSLQMQPEKAVLDGPLKDPEPFREAVRRAIASRLKGDDTSNVEHRFQARLQLLAPKDRLGLVTFIPEYPTLRPIPGGNGVGSIDFLGVDKDGRLHAVETKVGASESTVFLQALDYWVWVEANRATLAADLGADPNLRAGLSVVVLPTVDGSVIQRHNRHVADRLSRAVPLEVWEANVDLDGSIRLLQVPFGDTRAGDRWVDRMRRRVNAAADSDGTGAGSPDDPTAGIHPGSAEAAKHLKRSGALHAYADRAHSSQRFALDLYGSLDTSAVMALLAPFFGAMASAELPHFEWTDSEDGLGEATPARSFRTQVDVLLAGDTIDGKKAALLVEVKLTEEGFGGCSHAEVAPSPNRGVCSQPGPFGGDVERCWQLRNRETGDRRRYNQVLSLAAPDSVDVGTGCWFFERNQPMRLAALAGALEESGRYDRCLAVLTAPAGHSSIRRRWVETTGMVSRANQPHDAGIESLGWLEPETILSELLPEAQAFLIARYGLGPPTAFVALPPTQGDTGVAASG